MFENFVASVAPKSFNLERYLAKSKQITKVSTKFANLVNKKLQEDYSYYNRTGPLASATACNGTIVTITDTNLASALYVSVTSDGFNEKLNAAYTHIGCFSDMKFFVNKKEQQVTFVYYNCELDRSKDFLENAYNNLLELASLFSTDEYVVYVDYYKLFHKFLWGSSKTSFLTSFFTSIVAGEYPYSSKVLSDIVSLFLSYDNLSFDLHTQVPGMYIGPLDSFFENSSWPYSIQVNMLRHIHNKKTFNSYDEFFRKYDTDKIASNFENFETHGFVFDESAVEKASTHAQHTDELETWTVSNNLSGASHVVLKIKDMEHANVYLYTTYACFKSGFLDGWTVVPNATKSTVYLVFNLPSALSLESDIARVACSSITSTMQAISKKNWNFSLKANAPLLKCFYIIDTTNIRLNPLYIHQLDFGNERTPLDYKLIILNIIEEFLKSRNVSVKNIYIYSFMKILPPNFARNVISYLENGTLLDTNTDNWGNVLTYEELSNIRFAHNLSRISPEFVTFFTSALSDSNVKKFISNKSTQFENDYINSQECLQYISDIGLELTDDTLARIFKSTESFFLHPTKIIVSKDFCVSNSYQIIGVVWNECALTTIGNLIQTGKIDTSVFYKLLSSLLSIHLKHDWVIDESNICQMLVNGNNDVFLNYNGLKHSPYNKRIHIETHFKTLFNALKFHLPDDMPFENFSYDELYDNGHRTTASNVLLCKEHNLYYIEGSLCPECRKIYCVLNRSPSTRVYEIGLWKFCKSDYQNSLLAKDFGTSLNPMVIKQCKLGIENGLYDKFFFKPSSLAFLKEKVVGVMYFGMGKFNFNNLLPISMFESRQRLQVILVMYKKLLPLILDGSCITDSEDFFDSIAMHKDYKGELIILKLPFMDCEAILARDINAIEETKFLFAEFLIKYIKADTCLNAACNVKGSELDKLIQDIDSLKFTKTILEECISAFCNVHNVPFSSKNTLCPLCLADGIGSDNIIVLPSSHFEQLQKGKPLFEGGEATLYTYSKEQIQKLFKPGVDLVFKSKIIGKAIQKRALFKAFNDEHTDIKFITIDKVLYESNRNGISLKGFLQEEIEDSFKISFLKDKEFVANHNYTRYDITEILIKVCIGIEFLHSIGGYIGDLNGGNILIRGKTVYFIDMDGMSFDEVRNYVYTDMYIYPPSAKNKNITKDDDWYSLAVQAFYYFTYSHPFRGVSGSPLIPKDEITRMTLGISVIGNQIKVPSISEGWNFMTKELLRFFKNTFEKGKRESMRSVLEQFKATLVVPKQNSEMKFAELNRISPCRFALSYNTYIDTSGYLLWDERRLLKFSSGTISCKITGDYIILTSPNNSVVLNDATGHFNVYSAVSKDDKVYGANDKLFYISSLDKSVHVKQISSKSQQEADGIVVEASTLCPFDFLVTNERKFVFLVNENDYVHIYCNLEKLTSVDTAALGNNLQSHLFYDSESENYLVLLTGNHQTVGVLISSDGSYSNFSLDQEISNSSCFYKNTLYYMIGDTIYFYNVVDGSKKEFTSKFAASGCLIERTANRFVICSKDKTYMYVKP